MPKGRRSNPSTEEDGKWKVLNMEFPFSRHDNRHALHKSGEYFDTGLGRKKPDREKSQLNSLNFNLWCHEKPPDATSSLDGFTNYQTSYIYQNQQHKEPAVYRRYPKNHLEKAQWFKPLQNSAVWIPNYDNYITPVCSITASDVSSKCNADLVTASSVSSNSSVGSASDVSSKASV
ncbi:testis-expressed protein 36 isoform X2 [Microcaecilia unicolor]|uniref:Testis-expressed protein 36 isoform X2 n=1 Tax=Microcaecilia unicolor TaxID=1415580 RepID=A0A6P7YD23_9AMPH|nr:testis-expressed protein 36 isoform X2 [Microcaecilia unicolor]